MAQPLSPPTHRQQGELQETGVPIPAGRPAWSLRVSKRTHSSLSSAGLTGGRSGQVLGLKPQLGEEGPDRGSGAWGPARPCRRWTLARGAGHLGGTGRAPASGERRGGRGGCAASPGRAAPASARPLRLAAPVRICRRCPRAAGPGLSAPPGVPGPAPAAPLRRCPGVRHPRARAGALGSLRDPRAASPGQPSPGRPGPAPGTGTRYEVHLCGPPAPPPRRALSTGAGRAGVGRGGGGCRAVGLGAAGAPGIPGGWPCHVAPSPHQCILLCPRRRWGTHRWSELPPALRELRSSCFPQGPGRASPCIPRSLPASPLNPGALPVELCPGSAHLDPDSGGRAHHPPPGAVTPFALSALFGKRVRWSPVSQGLLGTSGGCSWSWGIVIPGCWAPRAAREVTPSFLGWGGPGGRRLGPWTLCSWSAHLLQCLPGLLPFLSQGSPSQPS